MNNLNGEWLVSVLSVLKVKTKHGEAVFTYYALFKWNKLPKKLQVRFNSHLFFSSFKDEDFSICHHLLLNQKKCHILYCNFFFILNLSFLFKLILICHLLALMTH